MPGFAQTAGDPAVDHCLLAVAEADPGVNWQIANAKFFSPVGPGEALSFTLEVRGGCAIAFRVGAAGRDVASGSLTVPAA